MLHEINPDTLFDLLTENEMCGHFMQENATAHTANNFVSVLAKVLVEQVINQGLWPACSFRLNPCIFHLWGTLKDEVYVNNPHSLQELKKIWAGNFCYFKRTTLLCIQKPFFRTMRPI
jgi:hypothetical protein